MLIGIKSRSEVGPGELFSATTDILWFLGIFLSFFGIVVLLFTCKTIQSEAVVVLYSVVLLLMLFIANPVPIYSIAFLLILFFNILWQHRRNKIGKKKAY
jgi:hypothetical protein